MVSEVSTNRMKVSREGVILIKSFEGFRPRAERQDDGRWVVGYGHTASAREGATISEAEAELLLQYDLVPVVALLNERVTQPLNQHQFDALASFAVSIGPERFANSSVLDRINAGQSTQAADALALWPDDSLPDASKRRRNAERALFIANPAEPTRLSDLLAAPLVTPAEVAPAPEAVTEPAPAAVDERPMPPPWTGLPDPEEEARPAPTPVAFPPAAFTPVDFPQATSDTQTLAEPQPGPWSDVPALTPAPVAAPVAEAVEPMEAVAPVVPDSPFPEVAAPIVEAPIVEAPVVEAPVVEAPVVEPVAPEVVAETVAAPVAPEAEEAATEEAPLGEAPVEEPSAPVTDVVTAEAEPVAEAPALVEPAPVDTAPVDDHGFPALTTASQRSEALLPQGTAEDTLSMGATPLVLTPGEGDEFGPIQRAVWDETTRSERMAADGMTDLDDLPLDEPNLSIVRHEIPEGRNRRFEWEQTGSWLFMALSGLVACGASAAALRLADSPTVLNGDELRVIGWCLAVIALICVGVSAWNLYVKWDRSD